MSRQAETEIERITSEASMLGWDILHRRNGLWVFHSEARSLWVNYRPIPGTIIDVSQRENGAGDDGAAAALIAESDDNKAATLLKWLRDNGRIPSRWRS